jgi:hypothetical protein
MQRQLKAPVFRISETRGNTIETYDKQMTPIARTIHVQLPFTSIVLHRPRAVEVHQQATTYRLPIYNVTSRVTSIIFFTGLATVLVPFVIRTIFLRRSRSS